MDDGLIQFIVIALFVIISLMEGVSRKKRQRRSEFELWDVPEDLSGGGGTQAETSESLVPDEVWEEIAQLARSEATTSPERIPPPQAEPSPRLPERTDGGVGLAQVARTIPSVEQSGAVERAEATEVAQTAAFHRLHSVGLADLKKDEHYIIRSRRSALLRMFGERGGRVGELRRAVLLSEILGPPVSLRDPADR